jgi:hypothetical protein
VAHIVGTEAAEAAFMNALYDEHATVLCRYAMRLTGDASRAEDVVQETLLRAWQPKSRLHYAVRALRLTLQEMGVTR